MRVLALIAVALVVWVSASCTASARVDRIAPPTTNSASPTSGGIDVGPPLAPAPTPPGGAPLDTGQQDDPGFFDVPGKVRKAINDWFRGLVEDALRPGLELLGRTVLATPQVAGLDRVREVWQVSLGIANALLVLVLIAAGALAMTHETVQTRYALKDLVPRVVLGAVAANASLAITGQMIGFANALSAGLLAGPDTPAAASDRLDRFVGGAVTDGGIFLILLGLACAVLTVVLLILYVIRAATVVLLVCAAPLMLLAHALPQTDGLARLWWRSMTAALLVQAAQALTLGAALRIFFAPDGRATLGLGTSGSLIDLLVVICLLWVMIKIPFWAKDLAFSRTSSTAARAAKVYVMTRVARAAAV